MICLLLVAASISGYAQAPVANIVATPVVGCPPLDVSFADNSTNNPTSWQWSFPGGLPSGSNQPNVAVSYTTPGTYTATLITKNAFGTSQTATKVITVHPIPVADFIRDKTTGCYPTHVKFTDKSTTVPGETVTSYLWNFGDGTQSGEQSPDHRYTNGGNIQVTLYVKNNYGCTGNTQIKNVQNAIVLTGGIFPNFNSILNSSCTLPVTASFNNTTTTTGGIPTPTWNWDFGDGAGFTNTSFAPMHNYSVANTYTVRLAATSSGGCSDTLSLPINITSTGNLTDFSAPDTVCLNALVDFKNISSPNPASSTWDYGDGSPQEMKKDGQHTYTSTGLKSVTLVNTFAGCGGNITKNILVVNPPVSDFSGTNLAGCQAPLTANFTNLSSGAASWLWNFGDGTTSTTQNPGTHVYNAIGTYTVTLTSTAAAGCASSTPKAAFVVIKKPSATINKTPAFGCAPFNFAATATPVTADAVSSYTWDLGNGVTSTSANPPAQNYAPGNYIIKLRIITSGGCTFDTTGTVQVGTVKPVPNFSFAPSPACVKSLVNFTDASSAGTNRWMWEYGDGSVDNTNTPTPKYAYTKPGTYSVRLTAYNNGCWDTLSKTIVISPPLAYFKFTTSGCTSNIFTFTDSSTIAPGATFTWDFGDLSAPVTVQNPPAHTFPTGAPQTYNVSLTVTNGTCTDKITTPVTANQAPTVKISKNPICIGEIPQFSKLPPGGNYSYRFDLGDGTYSPWGPGESYGKPYNVPGTYLIRVIERNNITLCEDSSSTVPLVVNGPIVSFTAPPALTCKALTFTFNGNPATGMKSYLWDFGDGNSSTSQSVSHTYNTAGNFSPSLTVTDNTGCVGSFTLATPITVSIPVASFKITDTFSCPNAPNPIRFFNTSIGGFNPDYTWDMGDGSPVLNDVNPIYTYMAAGSYPVKLSMKDLYGCISDTTFAVPITVDIPVASFKMSDSFSTCPPFNVQFTFTGHYAKGYAWDFTDGNGAVVKNPINLFNNPGVYLPNLVVTSPGGCKTLPYQDTVTVEGPVGAFTYSPLSSCDSLFVTFNVSSSNVVSFKWIYGDGTPYDSTNNPVQTHMYRKPGRYYPIVYIEDAKGCTLSKIGTDAINIDAISKVSFTADKNIVCDSGTVNFKNTSTLGFQTTVTNYHWDFGDGVTHDGLDSNISHKYITLGNDSVTLTITTLGGCSGSTKIGLSVVASPKVSYTGQLNQCEPAVLNYAGTVTDPNTPIIWSWVFGNGQTSSSPTPPAVSYPKAGEYVVYLKATNSKGCSTMTDTAGTATHLFIYPIPTVNAGQDVTICDTSFLQLNATGNATSYNWTANPPGALSCTNCSNPVANSSSSTFFIVTGTTLNTCTAKDTINVTVNTPVTITATGTDSVCLGQSAQLNATGGAIYSWTPAAGLSDANIANPVSKPDATMIGTGSSNVFTYTVTGYDNRKCYSDTKIISVTAFKYPEIDLVPNATINVGSTYQITSTASTNIVSLNWTPPSYLSCTNCLTPVAKPITTTKYNLTAINDGGCATTDSIRIQVICTGANFFVPNSFSPNGDGVNDYFIVNGVGLNVIPAISIYNRWGQLVFQKSNFAPNSSAAAWDGTFNGQPAPPDVYIYTIQILCDNATLIPYHGNVTLIR